MRRCWLALRLHGDLAMSRLAHSHISDTKLLYPHPKVGGNCSATFGVMVYAMLGTAGLLPTEALLINHAWHNDLTALRAKYWTPRCLRDCACASSGASGYLRFAH